ncbi:MAG: glucokinase, partial [Acidocella sp.]|nr:glucokinase [Acidocella sp.]
MRDIVASDIGGTHARFCTARIARGRVLELGPATTLHTADYPDLISCWRAYTIARGGTPPDALALALACPIGGETLQLTNHDWVIRPASLARDLGVAQLTLVNDFGAVAHAVSHLTPAHLRHITGPDAPRVEGVTTLLGPGTGLGVAQLLRRKGVSHIIECEGGHADFAPRDTVEDAILAYLRARHGRGSNERIVSGPGLANIYAALAAIKGIAVPPFEHKTLWDLAIAG